MINKHNYKNKTTWLLHASLGIILIGIVTSLIQMRQTINIQTKAENHASAVDQKNCSVPPDQLQISSEEQKLLDQINTYRNQNGLNKLVWSDSLIKAAKWMSIDMLTNKYLNHTDSLGRDVKTRLSDCGYTSFISIGENLDSGAEDSTTIIQAWKHSSGHNANMLNAKYKEAGIGFAFNTANGSYYWTLDLGNSTVNITSTPTPLVSPTTIISSSPTQSLITTTPALVQPSSSPLPANRFTPTATPKPTLAPVPATIPGFTPNPLDMQLFVSTKIIGIGEDGNRDPKHLTRSVTVGVYDMKNQLVKEGYGFIIYDRINLFRGIIHFGPVENGTYFIKILTPHMLRAVVTPTFQALDSKRLNILPQVTLLQGDINDDNVVNIADYNLALGCFQDKNCQDKNLIDFSDDGLANIIDYNILLHDYWEAQGD